MNSLQKEIAAINDKSRQYFVAIANKRVKLGQPRQTWQEIKAEQIKSVESSHKIQAALTKTVHKSATATLLPKEGDRIMGFSKDVYRLKNAHSNEALYQLYLENRSGKDNNLILRSSGDHPRYFTVSYANLETFDKFDDYLEKWSEGKVGSDAPGEDFELDYEKFSIVKTDFGQLRKKRVEIIGHGGHNDPFYAAPCILEKWRAMELKPKYNRCCLWKAVFSQIDEIPECEISIHEDNAESFNNELREKYGRELYIFLDRPDCKSKLITSEFDFFDLIENATIKKQFEKMGLNDAEIASLNQRVGMAPRTISNLANIEDGKAFDPEYHIGVVFYDKHYIPYSGPDTKWVHGVNNKRDRIKYRAGLQNGSPSIIIKRKTAKAAADEVDPFVHEHIIVPYDFETVYDPNLFGKLIPYSVSFTIKNKSYTLFGSDCAGKMLDILVSEQKDRRFTLLSYNGSRFDNILLVSDMLKRDMLNTIMYQNNSIINMRWCGRHDVHDICRFTTCSLDAACRNFQTKFKKLKDFKHDKIQAYFNEHGEIDTYFHNDPDCELLKMPANTCHQHTIGIGKCENNQDIINRYDGFLNKIGCKCSKYHELVSYNAMDVLSTLEIYKKVENFFHETGGLDTSNTLSNKKTIGSVIYDEFKRDNPKMVVRTPHKKTLIMNEIYNCEKLDWILKNTTFGRENTDAVARCKKMLKNGGVQRVKYFQPNGARHYPSGGTSITSIPGWIRDTICEEYYQDIDMVNAGATILAHICRVKNIAHPHLMNYVNNRQTVLNEIAAESPWKKMTRDDCKQVIMTALFGGNVANITQLKCVLNLAKEVERIGLLLPNLFPKESAAQQKRFDAKIANETFGADKQFENTFLATMVYIYENMFLMAAYKFIGSPRTCSFQYDGLLVLKTHPIDIDALNQHMIDDFGIHLQFKVKSMEKARKISVSELVKQALPKTLPMPTYKEYEAIRSGLYAGRVQCYKNKQGGGDVAYDLEGKNGDYGMLDVVSLYPYVMLNRFYPCGDIIDYPHSECLKQDLIGFYLCKFSQPIAKNIVPFRCPDKKKMLPLDWNFKGEMTAFLSTVDINALLRENCPLEIQKYPADTSRAGQDIGFCFTHKIHGSELFKCLIPYKNMKQQQDIYKRTKDPRYNEVMRGMAKLVLNSLSGKVIENLHEKESTLTKSLLGIERILKKVARNKNPDNHEIVPQHIFDGRHAILSYKQDRDLVFAKGNRPLYLGVLIYAYSRDHMYTEILRDYDVIYQDTDSALLPKSEVDRFLAEKPDSFGEEFGQFTFEDHSENMARFITLSPKNYFIFADKPFFHKKEQRETIVVKKGFKGVNLERDKFISDPTKYGEIAITHRRDGTPIYSVGLDAFDLYYNKGLSTVWENSIEFINTINKDKCAYVLCSSLMKTMKNSKSGAILAGGIYQRFLLKKITI